MRRSITSLGVALVLALSALPLVQADGPDPVDCALALEPPHSRTMAWSNATSYRDWTTNATFRELRTLNSTLAQVLGTEEPPEGNGTVHGNATEGAELPPGPDVAGKLDHVVRDYEHVVTNHGNGTACFDESLGANNTVEESSRAAGAIGGTLATFLAPVPYAVGDAARYAECHARAHIFDPTLACDADGEEDEE